MLIIDLNKSYKKAYEKRIKNNPALRKKLIESVELFSQNFQNPDLHNHKLKGPKKGEWSFSITGDYRVVYRWIGNNMVEFVDVGTHNQVYGR